MLVPHSLIVNQECSSVCLCVPYISLIFFSSSQKTPIHTHKTTKHTSHVHKFIPSWPFIIYWRINKLSNKINLWIEFFFVNNTCGERFKPLTGGLFSCLSSSIAKEWPRQTSLWFSYPTSRQMKLDKRFWSILPSSRFVSLIDLISWFVNNHIQWSFLMQQSQCLLLPSNVASTVMIPHYAIPIVKTVFPLG